MTEYKILTYAIVYVENKIRDIEKVLRFRNDFKLQLELAGLKNELTELNNRFN